MVFAYLFTIVHQKLTQRCGKFDFNSIKKNIFMSSPQKLKEDSGLLSICLENDKKNVK